MDASLLSLSLSGRREMRGGRLSPLAAARSTRYPQDAICTSYPTSRSGSCSRTASTTAAMRASSSGRARTFLPETPDEARGSMSSRVESVQGISSARESRLG